MADKMTLEEQIEHMLRLAEDSGATQEERDIAAKRAEKLMVQHGIERAMLDPHSQKAKDEKIVVKEFVVWGGSGTYAMDTMLGIHAINSALGLKAYISKRQEAKYGYGIRDPKDGKYKAGIIYHVVGFEGDVDDAIQLYHSVAVQARVAMDAWWGTEPLHRVLSRQDGYKARREFIQYFGRGVARRVMDTRSEQADSIPGAAVVLVSRRDKVDAHYNTLGLGKARGGNRDSSGVGRGAGYAAGKESGLSNQRGVGGTRALSR